MKISEFISSIGNKHNNKLIIVKKGIFWIAINEQAFLLSKLFGFKITVLDKNSIKIGFPDVVKKKWLTVFEDNNIGYILYLKEESHYISKEIYSGKSITDILVIDVEDYSLTKERILKLKTIGLKENKVSNFLLKDKLEEIYFLLTSWIFKFPKKDRFYIREKIETLFFELLEDVYSYMYNLGDRKIIIKSIFNRVLIIREFTRVLYKIGYKGKNGFYLDLSERWIEIMKICKGIMNKKL